VGPGPLPKPQDNEVGPGPPSAEIVRKTADRVLIVSGSTRPKDL